jgi:hypothetical protein
MLEYDKMPVDRFSAELKKFMTLFISEMIQIQTRTKIDSNLQSTVELTWRRATMTITWRNGQVQSVSGVFDGIPFDGFEVNPFGSPCRDITVRCLYQTIQHFISSSREFPVIDMFDGIIPGTPSVVNRNTQFIDQNFIGMNAHPPQNQWRNYTYLQSEVQRGTVPRVYHKNAMKPIFLIGGSKNPFTRAPMDYSNLRKLAGE